jgi:hypothetical protein
MRDPIRDELLHGLSNGLSNGSRSLGIAARSPVTLLLTVCICTFFNSAFVRFGVSSGVFADETAPSAAEALDAASTSNFVSASQTGDANGVTTAPSLDFRRDVRPILSDKCFRCHGPDATTRKGELRLDRADGAERVLGKGAVDASELVRRITASDPSERMPPSASKLELTAQEIETLRRWVAEGAKYAEHWSFVPLHATSAPSVKDAEWPRGALDTFVLDRLEREGIEPAAEASRERSIRRVTMDLTGLPPTIDEIDAFLDDRSEDAYERLVDRLLSSPAHAERLTAEWLDVARYADSYGYQVDGDRFVWPWRDWVIRAFARNQPFDEFITWQLAGDLLPDASDEQILATTFQRLHSQNNEGGSVPEEFRVEHVADRTTTFATTLLGVTMECARCHSHKYDPFPQTDYYRLFAFFANIDEAGLYSYFTPAIPTPTLLLADAPTKARMAELEKRIADEEAKLSAVSESREDAFSAWLASRRGEALVSGRIAHLTFETPASGPNTTVPGPVGNAIRLSGDDGIGAGVGNFHRYQPFSVALWMKTPDVKERAVVYHRSGAWTDAASRGYELLIEEGKLSAALIHYWPGNGLRVVTKSPIPVGEWIHVAVTYDGSSRAAGLRIYVGGAEAAVDVIRDGLTKNITGGGGDNLAIGERFRDRGFAGGEVDEFQVFDRELAQLEVAQIHDGRTLAAVFEQPVDALSSAERGAIRAYWLRTLDEPYRAQLEKLRAAREAMNALVDPIAEIMVMRELDPPRTTHVLRRGAYDAPGDPVEPGTPEALSPFPDAEPRNRLGLARWLTHPDHPLFARVTVNRYWQLIFGNGLVRTPEDFGSQGSPPTHPELLDWLAHDFLSNGWDLRRLIRQMVTSSTYRQASEASPELHRRDPENTLLARGARYRWPAEMIRDTALAASGLLTRRIGGEPSRPYEVEVSFKPVGRHRDDRLYRRSVYTYWRRTAPAPVMLTFDAASREVCAVKRERTASPIQAIVLFNDPQIVEASRVLGIELVRKHGLDAKGLVEEAFRRLTSRRPDERELAILTRLHAEQLAYFAEDASRAEAYLRTGEAAMVPALSAVEVAAAASVINTLIGYDECIVKR